MNTALTIISSFLLVGLIVFQFLLAVGLPYGKASWGGKYTVLPKKLRIASFFAIFILLFALSCLLEKTGSAVFYDSPVFVKYVTWFFTAYFAFNILGNLTSKSKIEKIVMTPVAAVLFLSFLLISLLS